MKTTIVDLRYRMKDVLRAIDRGETVTVLYHGKEKARLVPVEGKQTAVRTEDTPMFGMWKDREDMADPVAYVRKLRDARFSDLFDAARVPQRKKRVSRRNAK